MEIIAENKKIIAKRLRILRAELNISQGDLAKKARTTQRAISDWETAKSLPKLKALILIAAAFGKSVDFFLTK